MIPYRTMQRGVFGAAVALLLFAPAAASAEATAWEADVMHTQVGFSVRHMMISNVRGEFRKFSIKVRADPKDLNKASVEVSIDVKSIATGVDKRDEHLRNSDFFHVAKFPTITFQSKSVKKVGKDQLKVVGELTLRGVKKPVTLEVSNLVGPIKDPMGSSMKVGFQATTKINRKDFGLSWNKLLEAGGLAVGNDVTITIDAELNQAKK